MLSSMTGYGRATCQIGGQALTVEFKSVNHRYLDLTLHLPNEWLFLEEGIKRQIQSQLNRGKVTGYLTLKGTTPSKQAVTINWAVFDQYQQAMAQLTEKLGEKAGNPLNERDWLLMPNLFHTEEIPLDATEFERPIQRAVGEALDQLIAMRQKEGQFLKQEIVKRIALIKQGLTKIESVSPQLVENYQTRLEERIRELLANQADLDEARLINEVAIFAEKTDITEEMARLESHLAQFLSLLDQTGPIGRPLDFLIQEMNREINTMGSKSPDVTITQEVVHLKSEVEKIREQVQNIE